MSFGAPINVIKRFIFGTCSCCGHISKENRKSQSLFKCIKCGNTLNADYNASINILNAAGTVVKTS